MPISYFDFRQGFGASTEAARSLCMTSKPKCINCCNTLRNPHSKKKCLRHCNKYFAAHGAHLTIINTSTGHTEEGPSGPAPIHQHSRIVSGMPATPPHTHGAHRLHGIFFGFGAATNCITATKTNNACHNCCSKTFGTNVKSRVACMNNCNIHYHPKPKPAPRPVPKVAKPCGLPTAPAALKSLNACKAACHNMSPNSTCRGQCTQACEHRFHQVKQTVINTTTGAGQTAPVTTASTSVQNTPVVNAATGQTQNVATGNGSSYSQQDTGSAPAYTDPTQGGGGGYTPPSNGGGGGGSSGGFDVSPDTSSTDSTPADASITDSATNFVTDHPYLSIGIAIGAVYLLTKKKGAPARARR
jgi:hypothetical protein